MKLPDLGGKVITIKSYQKEAKKCYENSLKKKKGVFMVTTRAPSEEGVAPAEIACVEMARERRSEPAEKSWRGRLEARRSNLANH